MSEKKKEPLIHITKRAALPWYFAWGVRALAVIAALAVCALICILMTGVNPLELYATMFSGSFGTTRRTWVTMQNVALLLCVSLAVTPAFRMRFWNIGAEGQTLMGCFAAAACMILLRNALPNWAIIACMVIASITAGALWGMIPAIFKAKWNTNETLFTLMLNYIATQLVAYFCVVWESPKGAGQIGIINPTTGVYAGLGWLPNIGNGPGAKYLLSIIVIVLICLFMHIYLKYTKHGFEIAVVGDSENTARYCAIDVKKVIIRTMMLSGAICGIAGFLAVAGAGHTISTDTAGGRGFTTIIVAWMSKFNSFIMAAVSAFLVFLEKGAMQIASQYQLSDYISNVVKGIILIFLLGSEFFVNFKIRIRGSHKTEVTK